MTTPGSVLRPVRATEQLNNDGARAQVRLDFSFYTALFLVSLLIRTGYEVLKERKKVRGESKPLFILVLIAMIVMWMSWFAMCPLDPLQVALPELVHTIGLTVQIAGFYLAIAALVQPRGVKNIKRLVTAGIFSKLRHSIYLGFIFGIVGAALYHGAATSLAAGLLGIGNILYWQCLEEARLTAAFGERYLAYRRTTWF